MSSISSPAHVSLIGARSSGRRTWHVWVTAAADVLLTWHERSRQRRQLHGLSDHMLHDMGLGRVDVEAEAAKPFWRP